jgi:hypothetical protein
MYFMSKVPAWEISREIRVKAEEETKPEYGCPPEERSLNELLRFGMVIIDKTAGPTMDKETLRAGQGRPRRDP